MNYELRTATKRSIMAKSKLDETKVAENVKELIEHLGVSATAEISKVDNTYFVDIISDDSSLLIGKHGANLEALQFVLAVRLKSRTADEDFELFVDVDGWRKQKEERLQAMAQNLATKVAESGKDEILYDLKPSERRVIHSTLTEHPKVTTLSEGAGEK